MWNETKWQNWWQIQNHKSYSWWQNFAEDPLEIHAKTFIPEVSVDTTLINSNNDNYSETNKSFIDEHINCDDLNKTASDSEITINSMEHHCQIVSLLLKSER